MSEKMKPMAEAATQQGLEANQIMKSNVSLIKRLSDPMASVSSLVFLSKNQQCGCVRLYCVMQFLLVRVLLLWTGFDVCLFLCSWLNYLLQPTLLHAVLYCRRQPWGTGTRAPPPLDIRLISEITSEFHNIFVCHLLSYFPSVSCLPCTNSWRRQCAVILHTNCWYFHSSV